MHAHMLTHHMKGGFHRVTACYSSASHRTLEEIGHGQFGTVYRGILQTSEGPRECALKMLREGSTPSERVKFLQEAAIIGQFYHQSIVRLWGVVLSGGPVGVLCAHSMALKFSAIREWQAVMYVCDLGRSSMK